MLNMKDVLRFTSLAAVLLAGSCAAPMNDGGGLLDDPAANHPIVVEPAFQSIKLSFSVPEAGLLPDDAARFNAFIADYVAHGNGALSISAPAGGDAPAAIRYFGERLASMGVPRAHILAGTHDVVDGDTRIELGYIGYQAHTDPCGDWSENLGDTASNRVAPDFGCSVQHNIAAMVSDPRDLVAPQPQGDVDAARRAIVMQKYEKGEPTAAQKTQDQSGAVAAVSKQ